MNPVAILGGGITGLVAAFQLRQKNIPVTVLEAADRVGGVIQTVRQDGYLAEYGPNTLLETSPKIKTLVRDLGLESRLLYTDPRAEKRFLVRGARPVELPASPPAFFATPLFSWRAKLRLVAEPFIGRCPPAREESLAEFVLRRLGREFLDYAINPFVAGVYAGDPARLSVQHAFPKLHALEQRYGSLIVGQIRGARERKRRAEVSKQDAPKISFDEGLQVLTDTLGARLGSSVRLRAPVMRLRRRPEGWEVTTRLEGREQKHTHAAVLLTAPTYQLAELDLATSQGPGLKGLAPIHYPPVASLVLGFRRDEVEHPLDGYGMLIPEIERFHILGTIFSSSLFPNRAPAGHVTLTSYLGGTRAPELASRDPAALVELTLQDLRTLLGVRGRPTFQHHCFFPKAIPQYDVGYGRFKELMDQLEAAEPGLFLGGHYRDGISLSDSILAGYKAAERLEQFLAAASGPRPEAQPTSPSLVS